MSNQTCFPQRYWSPCGRAYKSTRRVIRHRQRPNVFDHASRGEALAPALRRGAARWPTGAHVRRPCSRPRICRHRSQATSFDGRQLTRYSTQKMLVWCCRPPSRMAFTRWFFPDSSTLGDGVASEGASERCRVSLPSPSDSINVRGVGE